MAQADEVAFRWIRVDTSVAARGTAPVDGLGTTGTVPDVAMSPFTASKMPTTGLALMLHAPVSNTPATPNVGGFTVQVWLRDPHTGFWGSFASVTIDYRQTFVTFDIDAGELFFEVTGVAVAGTIDIGIAEQ